MIGYRIKFSNNKLPACETSSIFRSTKSWFWNLIKFKGNASYTQVINLAKNALGKDEEGYRFEFVQLVKTAQSLDTRKELAETKKIKQD